MNCENEVVLPAVEGGVCSKRKRKSRVLIIGATGYMGHFLANASLQLGHPTVALIRPSTLADPDKADLIREFRSLGMHIFPVVHPAFLWFLLLIDLSKLMPLQLTAIEFGLLQGCLHDRESMLRAIREVDVVISAVGGTDLLDQLKIIDAIKEVGSHIKRFVPSEFGHDVDKAQPVEPALGFYQLKRKIRRATEEAKVGHTYICCNSIAGWPYYYHTHPSKLPPPTEKIEIYGNGNVKAYFITGKDIGTFTMNAIDDPRTLNKKLHFRPAANFLTMNELADMWESKIGRKMPRIVVEEQDLLQLAKANLMPASIVAALTHDIFINGCQYKFSIDGWDDVEACELYPEIDYVKMEDHFDEWIPR